MSDLVLEKRTYQKSVLAKLLARENLQIEIQNVHTAMFDPVHRILIIPKLKDYLSENIYNMYILHEVSHALNTPGDGWSELSTFKIPNHIKQIVEDSRIEKLIKLEYPGGKKYFYLGWRELFGSKGLGPDSIDKINKLNFMDRYNIHFKMGESCNISFSEKEQVFIEKGKNLQTWKDSVELMKELKLFVKEQKEKEPKKEKIDGITIEIEMGSENGDYDEECGGDSNKDDEKPSEGLEGGSGESKEKEDGNDSITQELVEELQKEIVEFLQDEIINIYANETNWQNHIISYQKIFFRDGNKPFRRTSIMKYIAFAKPYVNYMAQQFNLKKNATEYQNISFNKTGNLDLNRIHEYCISDDLFIRNTIQKEGQSHGLVLFLDWSGSMEKNLTQSLYQCFFLTDFCRKVNIPFETYAFTSGMSYDQKNIPVKKPLHGDIYIQSYKLMNILSSKMTNVEYLKMQQILLSFADKTKNLDIFSMGGTPLDSVIMAAMEIVPLFQQEHKLDNVNICFITDGDGYSPTLYHGLDGLQKDFSKSEHVYIHDRKIHNVKKLEKDKMTIELLDMLKNRTKCNIIGFYLANLYDIQIGRFSSQITEFEGKKILTTTQEGYTEYHIIDTDLINITPGKIDNRIKFILNRFIKLIV